MTPQEALEILYKGIAPNPTANNECIELCKKALAKQTSKEVKYLNRHGDGPDLWNKDYFHCPSCGRRLRNKQKDDYCGGCGQALDWGEHK